jgi:hypothetical protein
MAHHERETEARIAGSSGVGIAIRWIEEHWEAALEEALENGFYGILNDEELEVLEEIPEHMQDLADLNSYDWLLAEGELCINDEPVRTADLVLASDGPSLTPAQRDHLEALRASPIGLYQVLQVDGIDRVTLGDILHAERPRSVSQGGWAGEFRAGSIVGLRVLPGHPPEVSGAFYPFPRTLRDQVVDTVNRMRTDYPARRSVDGVPVLEGMTIASSWLLLLCGAARYEPAHKQPNSLRSRSRPLPRIVDARTGDPALLVTDRYVQPGTESPNQTGDIGNTFHRL